MEQVRVYLKGARDYTLLEGPTGPCVYPAGHVYIYSALYQLTDEGANIARAQVIFAGVYLVTLGVVGAVYRQCKVSLKGKQWEAGRIAIWPWQVLENSGQQCSLMEQLPDLKRIYLENKLTSFCRRRPTFSLSSYSPNEYTASSCYGFSTTVLPSCFSSLPSLCGNDEAGH